jgi:hypothetical protein
MIEEVMAELARAVERTERQAERTQRQAERTDQQFALTEQEFARTARQFARTDRQMAKTDRQFAKTDQQISRLEQAVENSVRSTEAYKVEARADRVAMNRQWGELANRLGTMAEDLVAPSVPRVLREVLGLANRPIDSAVRVLRHLPTNYAIEREFDVVATCDGYMLVNETKSQLAAEDVARFVKVLATVRDYFPEHADKRVVGAIASLYVNPRVVRRGEAMGLIVLGFGEDVMDVLNTPGFVPRTF